MIKKILSALKDNIYFTILFLFLGGYYTYRMFGLAGSYDELYSYFNFTNRGLIYSATHWPLPNNHVFFSMASSVLNLFGNGYVGMRGIVFLSALASLVLLYLFLKDCFGKNVSLISCCAYAAMRIVNEMAVQGRGYSLATFMLMLCIYAGYRITADDCKKRDYFFWTAGLWLSLYTLVSSIYWVAAVCVCFGIVLLTQKEIRRLINLIISSAVAAVLTAISYAILWCNMGADYIQTVLGLQESNFKTIISHPRSSLIHGFNLMRGNQYMQGVDRHRYFTDFKYYFRSLFRDFTQLQFLYAHILILAITLVFFVIFLYVCKKNKQSKLKLPLLLSSAGLWVIFIVLTIQSSYPFNRVFSFLGIFFAIGLAIVLYGAACLIIKFVPGKYLSLTCIPALLICFIILSGPGWNNDYYDPDKYSDMALRNIDLASVSSYLADSEFGYYQMEFFKKNRHLSCEYSETNPDMIFLYTKEKNQSQYPFIVSPDTVSAIDFSNYNMAYENEYYSIYLRK